MKRFLATVMALVMLMGCVPVTASAWNCPKCGHYEEDTEGVIPIWRCSECNYFEAFRGSFEGLRGSSSTLPSHSIGLENAKGEGGGNWEKQNNNKMKFHCRLYNNEDSRTVKAVEIAMYAKNVWGELVWGEDTYYTGTTTCEIKPGHWHYSEWFVLPDRSEISTLHVFIKRIAFTDGTVIEVDADNADGVYWDIKW